MGARVVLFILWHHGCMRNIDCDWHKMTLPYQMHVWKAVLLWVCYKGLALYMFQAWKSSTFKRKSPFFPLICLLKSGCFMILLQRVGFMHVSGMKEFCFYAEILFLATNSPVAVIGVKALTNLGRQGCSRSSSTTFVLISCLAVGRKR